MTIVNIVFCNATAHMCSPNMDLGSVALGILESGVIKAQQMAHVLERACILT